MDAESRIDTGERRFDVMICGAGLAGLTMALQLRQQHPALDIAVIDKVARPLPEAAHKVGESTVELGSRYLESLGLRQYLHEHHLRKFGLRFFPGGGQLPLEERTEIGPSQEPIIQSYQVDRGRLESDLREMIAEEDEATLFEGYEVSEVTLGQGGEPHFATLKGPSGRVRLQSRWLVDATGRKAILRRQMKLTRGTRHAASAGWFRIKGRLDINDLVPSEVSEWHGQEFAAERWRSTNHLMGHGYWVWVIPLSSGNTSIGAVVHEEAHPFQRVQTLARVRAFIEEHEPVLARYLADREVLDFLCIRDYSNTVGRSWSADRWAIVGEAGAFVDPLYSPGTDFIAFANAFTEELIRTDLAGGDLETRARELNMQYRVLVSGAVDIFRNAAPIYNHASAMRAKVFWDNLAYWTFLCQYYLQEIYRLTGAEHTAQVEAGQRIFQLSDYVQRLLREWAVCAPEKPKKEFVALPAFPSVLVDTHMALEHKMTPSETLDYVRLRAQDAEEIAGEFIVRVLYQLGEAKAQELFDKTGMAAWKVRISPKRIHDEMATGMGRRRALSPLARDVERSLGRIDRKTEEAQMLSLLQPLLTQRVPQPQAQAGV